MANGRSETIASKVSISRKTANAILNAVIESIVEAVAAGDKVSMVGFGSFESRQNQAREGHNPNTRKKMQVPDSKAPVFFCWQDM